MTSYKLPKLYDAGGSLESRWYVYYSFRSPDTGKFERFKISIPSNILTASGRRDEAHKIIKQYKQKLDEGWNPYQHNERRYTGLVAVLDEMVNIKLYRTRKRTSYTYRNIANTFKKYLKSKGLSKLMVSDFTKLHAQAYLDSLKRTKCYANRTYNNHLTSLKNIFKMMEKREYIISNPFSSFDNMTVEEASIIAFTETELAYVANTLPRFNFRLWLVTELIYYCFIRPQEIVRLRFRDIDLDRRQIKLAGRQTKNKRTQVVDIPDALAEDLMKIEWLPDDYFVFSKKLLPGSVEIAQTRIDEAWDEYRRHVNLPPDKTIYAMKNTGAGRLADAGIDVRSIQLQMRHHSLEETQRYLDRFRRTPNIALRKKFPKLG